MKQLSLLTLCLVTFLVSQAQLSSAQSEKKQKSFIISIKTMDHKVIKGRFYSVNDSQLVLLKSVVNSSDTLQAHDLQYIPAENIKSFSLIRKNSVLEGALIGLGAGIVAGGIAGFIEGDDPPASPGSWFDFSSTAQEKAFGYGAVLGIGGAIAGTITGALAKKNFTIGGKTERFSDLQSQIRMKLSKN